MQKKTYIWIQLFLSTVCVVIAVSIYLVSTYFLDMIIHPKLSNVIGTLIDTSLDFILQSLVFLGTIRFTGKLLSKFTIGKAISAVSAMLIFNIYYDVFKNYRLNKNINNKKSKSYLYRILYDRTLHIRVLGMFTTSIFIAFPLRKYWIYA